MDQFEKYHLNVVRDTMSNISNNVVRKMIPEGGDLSLYSQELQKSLRGVSLSNGYEISVINVKDQFKIVASTNESFFGKKALDILDRGTILKSLGTDSVETDIENDSRGLYKVKNLTFSNHDKNGEVRYIIYARASLDSIYKTLYNSKIIFVQATFIALGVTIILGFLISNSITNPINELKKTALHIAKGDFSKRVKVKSNDEIGQLSNVFNYLTERLSTTLSEISEEKTKLDAIIRHMADGLVAVDDKGVIIHQNPSFLRLLNLPRDFEEKDYDKIMSGISKSLTLKELRKSEKYGSHVIEIGKDSFLKANYAFFKNKTGEFSGLIVVMQDISENKKLDNMRREFVANVSHELKTPITTIKSYAETLMNGALEDEELSKEFVQVIENEADRMARLVKDLLQLSHLDFKKVKWDFRYFDFKDLLVESIRKLSIHVKEKSQKLIYIFPEEEVLIYGDKDKVEQVIVNLLSNAIKYTGEGGNITAKLYRTVDKYVLEIADNGIGIPKEDVERIFERFYRVDKARSREQGGTGLGLAISRHIVKEHGGDIRVESTLGKGSKFYLEIPVDKSVDM